MSEIASTRGVLTNDTMSVECSWSSVGISSILEQWRYRIGPIFNFDGLLDGRFVVSWRRRLEDEAVDGSEYQYPPDDAWHGAD
jgi:hypothetical protein